MRDREEDLPPFDLGTIAKCSRESEKAILAEWTDSAGHREMWVPKSQIHDDSEVYKKGTNGKLIVSGWFAAQKGLDGSKPQEEPPTRQISECRSCHAPIRWGKTAAGKNVPIDVNPSTVDGKAVYLSHFQTCPQASQHSRR